MNITDHTPDSAFWDADLARCFQHDKIFLDYEKLFAKTCDLRYHCAFLHARRDRQHILVGKPRLVSRDGYVALHV